MTSLDKKITWWWDYQEQQRLIKYAHALMMGRRYKVILSPDGTGSTDFIAKTLQVNPTLFKEKEVETQFVATKAIEGHEVGHILFTEEWPEARPSNLLNLANMLEDERIERCMTTLYPGLVEEFDLLGALEIATMKKLTEADNARVLNACLRWRWLHDQPKGSETLSRLNNLKLGGAEDLWDKVCPMVEEAWMAWGTVRVIEIAKNILDILKLPETSESVSRKLCRGITSPEEELGDFTRSGREEEALPRPTGPAETDPYSPTIHSATLTEYPSGNISKPEQYNELVETATAPSIQLSQALIRPEPDVSTGPHDYKGRFSVRQEIRTPETPNVYKSRMGNSGKDTVLLVLVDRSGSIARFNGTVRLALMTCYLAAIRMKIPVGVIFFGDDNDNGELVYMLGPISEVMNEKVLAGVAGFNGNTGAEFMHWGLDLARKELLNRPEQTKRLIVLHDGQPVYTGSKGNDLALSKKDLKDMPTRGITPIGVYLGNDESDITRLKELFEHLVVTDDKTLPSKLGNMLQSIM